MAARCTRLMWSPFLTGPHQNSCQRCPHVECLCRRSKVCFACNEQEVKAALEPHIDSHILYSSLGGTLPEDGYSYDRLTSLMQGLDKVQLSSCLLSL